MKIAVLASGSGDKARYIFDFFKEGNRVEIDCVVTDREEAEIGRVLGAEGVPIYYYAPEEWITGESILRLLQERGEEIIVIDGLDRPLPEAISEAFGAAVIYPSGVMESPGEVVTLFNKLTSKKPATEEKKKDENRELTPEEEWADILKVKYDPEEVEARKTPPPVEPPVEIPVVEVTDEIPTPEKESPAAPSFGPYPQYNQYNNPPGYGFNPGQPPSPRPEPMPDTYLIWAVLATIFCCLIPGIIAIIMSSSVSSRYFSGDIEGAKRASRRTEIWIIVAVVCGVIWLSLYIPLMLLTL